MLRMFLTQGQEYADFDEIYVHSVEIVLYIRIFIRSRIHIYMYMALGTS